MPLGQNPQTGATFTVSDEDFAKFGVYQFAVGKKFTADTTIVINSAAEFGEKLHEARRLADTGTNVAVRFDGGELTLPADSAMLLRNLWNTSNSGGAHFHQNIRIEKSNGELNFIQNRHPTEPMVPNSLWGLNGLVAVNWILADNSVQSSNGRPVLPVGGVPATVCNDSTVWLLRTLATQGKKTGEYVANVKDESGKMTDPVMACQNYFITPPVSGLFTTVDEPHTTSDTRMNVQELYYDEYNGKSGSLAMILASYARVNERYLKGETRDELRPVCVSPGQFNFYYSADPKYLDKDRYVAVDFFNMNIYMAFRTLLGFNRNEVPNTDFSLVIKDTGIREYLSVGQVDAYFINFPLSMTNSAREQGVEFEHPLTSFGVTVKRLDQSEYAGLVQRIYPFSR